MRSSIISVLLLIGLGHAIFLVSGFAGPPIGAMQNTRNWVFETTREMYRGHQVRAEESAALIVPGKSVGPLHLGDTESRFHALFPDGPNMDLRPTYNSDCGVKLHWVDLDPGHPLALGVIVLIHKGTITQIEAGTPRFRTEDGITWGSSPTDVKEHYLGLRSYEAVGTTSEVTGERNLVFWMDMKKGLGFVFAFSRITRAWVVYKVIVFSPSGKFCPEADALTPDNWRELAPYSLEAPNHRASLQ
jgi:hypothetical protein